MKKQVFHKLNAEYRISYDKIINIIICYGDISAKSEVLFLEFTVFE